ncbi:odorant binding protein 7 [Calliopsis andreniformis]|uniref:odorant binding protein 7 n=1 Tax=Calliopsis andreniformis TaxID=337506 RepID=UPI003FCDB793
MKYFAILLCIFFVTVSIGAIDLQRISKVLGVPMKDIDECLTLNHLNNEEVSKVESIFRNNLSPEELEKFMTNFSCFLSCAFEKSKVMQNEKIQVDEVLKIIERNNFTMNSVLQKKLNNCDNLAKRQTDKCEIALTFALCFVQLLRQS